MAPVAENTKVHEKTHTDNRTYRPRKRKKAKEKMNLTDTTKVNKCNKFRFLTDRGASFLHVALLQAMSCYLRY